MSAKIDKAEKLSAGMHLELTGEKKGAVGSPQLNSRGMPMRIRKKNKLVYFDDNEDALPSKTRTPKKSLKFKSPVKSTNFPTKRGRKPTQFNQMRTIIKNSLRSPKRSKSSTSITFKVNRTEQITSPISSPLQSPPPSPDSPLPLQMCATPFFHPWHTPSKSLNPIYNLKPEVEIEKEEETIYDKSAPHQNGLRLRNFLKLPQAHKWIYFEWFYSNLDKPLFEGDNDFQLVLKDAFPDLMAKMLTRRQWGMIRKMMGKPRRCSQAFFNEERKSLLKRRQILRLLQQRKITDIDSLKELPLPACIPMQLIIGTKVTARLRKVLTFQSDSQTENNLESQISEIKSISPSELNRNCVSFETGFYTGVINAVDTSNNTYRITFDRSSIGTHSVPDIEVVSNEAFETMSQENYIQQFKERFLVAFRCRPKSPVRYIMPKNSIQSFETYNTFDSPAKSDVPLSNGIDPIMSQPDRICNDDFDETIGGFPTHYMVALISLSKILKAKREKIDILKSFNDDAEMKRSFGQKPTLNFQRKYAALILDLENINRDLNTNLLRVQQFCQEIAPELGVSCPTLLPSQIKERSYEEAAAVVDLTNLSSGSGQVASPKILCLITKLTSVMLQLKNMTESDVSAFELNSLQETINEIKDSLDPKSKAAFEDTVQVHLSHILASVTRFNTLNSFEKVKR